MEKFDKRFFAGNFSGEIDIHHLDGSVFKLKNVFLKEEKVGDFEMLLVWTEHCGSFAFFKEDLEKWLYKES